MIEKARPQSTRIPFRIFKKASFDIFLKQSKSIFEELSKQSHDHQFLSQRYKLCIAPGGAEGGRDNRLVEIFYGQVKFDVVNEIGFDINELPVARQRYLTEIGARLTYQRVDNGTVFCTLEPARSERFRRSEDAIELQWVKDPHALIFSEVTMRHWRYFVSYMEYTSLDGEPSISDKIRVWWLLWTRDLVVDGKHTTAKYRTYGLKIVSFSLTIGLSGFLLALVQWYITKPK